MQWYIYRDWSACTTSQKHLNKGLPGRVQILCFWQALQANTSERTVHVCTFLPQQMLSCHPDKGVKIHFTCANSNCWRVILLSSFPPFQSVSLTHSIHGHDCRKDPKCQWRRHNNSTGGTYRCETWSWCRKKVDRKTYLHFWMGKVRRTDHKT